MKVHNSVIPFTWYKLSFLQVQLAMRRYHYGPQAGVSIESLFWTQVVKHVNISLPDGDMLMLFSVDAQICPEPLGLYVRVQDIMLVDSHRLDLLRWRSGDDECCEPPMIFTICCHVLPSQFGVIVNSQVDRYSDTDTASSTTYRCDKCCTDSQIGICEFDSKVALVVTRWIYLGPCITPADRRWMIHSQARKNYYGRYDPETYNPGSLEPSERIASVRTCYENASPQSFDELQSCNLSYLKNRRFEEFMYHASFSVACDILQAWYPFTVAWYLPFPKSQ